MLYLATLSVKYLFSQENVKHKIAQSIWRLIKFFTWVQFIWRTIFQLNWLGDRVYFCPWTRRKFNGKNSIDMKDFFQLFLSWLNEKWTRWGGIKDTEPAACNNQFFLLGVEPPHFISLWVPEKKHPLTQKWHYLYILARDPITTHESRKCYSNFS